MRAVIQRVTCASVKTDDGLSGEIGPGLLVLLGIAKDDTPADCTWLAQKIVKLRIFSDADGQMNRDVTDRGGEILVVSQFTLYADARRGRRPSFIGAAGPIVGERLYEVFCEILASTGIPVRQGRFGAEMDVELVNEGPFTIWLDSDELGIEPRPIA